MRREFTPISAVSMIIYFMAAVVICLQVAQTKALPEWRPSSHVLWILEVAIIGTAAYAWKPGISLFAWVLGIGGLVLARMGVSAAAATAFSLTQHSVSFPIAFARMSELLPRVCAIFFALMVCYPLRSALPVRLASGRARRRAPIPPGVDILGPASIAGPGGDAALWFVRGEEKIPVWMPTTQESQPEGVAQMIQPVVIDGDLDLPLRAVLAQVPQEMIGDRASRCDDSDVVSIPLAAIVPQLAEARIVIRLDDLAEWMPRGVIDVPPAALSVEGEPPLVLLPLELVVPWLPEGLLELPPPSPPAWAKAGEPEKVVFATV